MQNGGHFVYRPPYINKAVDLTMRSFVALFKMSAATWSWRSEGQPTRKLYMIFISSEAGWI